MPAIFTENELRCFFLPSLSSFFNFPFCSRVAEHSAGRLMHLPAGRLIILDITLKQDGQEAGRQGEVEGSEVEPGRE